MFPKHITFQYGVYAKCLKSIKNESKMSLYKMFKCHTYIQKKITNMPDINKVMKNLPRFPSNARNKMNNFVNSLSLTDKDEPKINETNFKSTCNKKNLKNLQSFSLNSKTPFYYSAATTAIMSNLEPANITTDDESIRIVENSAKSIENSTVGDEVAQATQSLPVIEPIPEPPPIPDESTFIDIATQLNALGEPSLASMGLGNWTPVGLLQRALEYLHVCGLPWWETIVIGTVVIRLLMFPLVIISQRNSAKMNNYLPQLQALQVKMTEARQSGNHLEAARCSQEIMIFTKDKGLNPLKNMIVPLCQMPVFLSFFIGLRKMANLPVESLREGGLFWFKDLTVPDQYFALPVITSLTLWVTIEMGVDSAKLSSQNLVIMKYVLRAMPVIILPFTVNFPGAILCYWVASNFISLAQVGFLRIPKVRDYFNIDPLITHDKKNLPLTSKGFVGGVKDSWTNMKITRQLEERMHYDRLQFQRAGRDPIVKTYKYDPTKQTSNKSSSVSAKAR